MKQEIQTLVFTHVGIIDTIAPTITCPPTQTVSSNDGCNHILDDFTGLATITDRRLFDLHLHLVKIL